MNFDKLLDIDQLDEKQEEHYNQHKDLRRLMKMMEYHHQLHLSDIRRHNARRGRNKTTPEFDLNKSLKLFLCKHIFYAKTKVSYMELRNYSMKISVVSTKKKSIKKVTGRNFNRLNKIWIDLTNKPLAEIYGIWLKETNGLMKQP